MSTETERAANTNFNIIVPKALITFPLRSAIVFFYSRPESLPLPFGCFKWVAGGAEAFLGILLQFINKKATPVTHSNGAHENAVVATNYA